MMLSVVSPVLLGYYQENREEFTRIANAACVATFSRTTKNELVAIGLDANAIDLVEAVTRIQNLAGAKDHADVQKAVSKLLKKAGTPAPRGKRTAPTLVNLVEETTPLLLHFGFPLASSERSKIVRALRCIADQYGVQGDPRDELRKRKRLDAIAARQARLAVMEAVRQGLSKLDG